MHYVAARAALQSAIWAYRSSHRRGTSLLRKMIKAHARAIPALAALSHVPLAVSKRLSRSFAGAAMRCLKKKDFLKVVACVSRKAGSTQAMTLSSRKDKSRLRRELPQARHLLSKAERCRGYLRDLRFKKRLSQKKARRFLKVESLPRLSKAKDNDKLLRALTPSFGRYRYWKSIIDDCVAWGDKMIGKVSDRKESFGEKAADLYASVRQGGWDYVKRHASKAWRWLTHASCGKVVERMNDHNVVRNLLKKIYERPARCMTKMEEGFICAIPDAILEIPKAMDSLYRMVESAMKHKSMCMPHIFSGSSGVPKVLLCGFAYLLKDQYAGKVKRCFRRLWRDGFFKALFKVLVTWNTVKNEENCKWAGEIALDVALAALSGGSSAVASVARWLTKVKKILGEVKEVAEAAQPGNWAKIAGEKAGGKGLGRLIDYAAKTFQKVCRF